MEVKFDPKNIAIVPISSVHPNPWNPKDKDTEQYQTIMRGLKEKGLLAPIFVRSKEGTDQFEIVDGEQRWTGWKELGNKEIVVYNMGDISDQEAKEMTLWFETKVPFNEITLAYMLKDMVDLPNLVVPYTKEQLENYTEMAQFDWEQISGEELTLIHPDSAVLIEVDPEQVSVIEKFVKDLPKVSEKKRQVSILGRTRFTVMQSQAKVILDAIRKVMAENDITDQGRALELIAADFLGGAHA